MSAPSADLEGRLAPSADSPPATPAPDAPFGLPDVPWDFLHDLRARVPTLRSVPNAVLPDLSRVWAIYLRQVVTHATPAARALAFRALYALLSTVLRCPGPREASRRSSRSLIVALRARCRAALRGDLQSVLDVASRQFPLAPDRGRHALHTTDHVLAQRCTRQRHRRVRMCLADGDYPGAMLTLTNARLADPRDDPVATRLRELHPVPPSLSSAEPELPDPDVLPLAPVLTSGMVSGALTRYRLLSGVGPDGLYPHVLKRPS